jgi:hypothetical protein
MAPIVSIDLQGGLGNQLFQIATAYAYAQEHGADLFFPETWDTRADRPSIWTTYLKQHPFTLMPKDAFQSIQWNKVQERGFGYSPIPPPSMTPYCKLNGYFQCSKYFGRHADEIRVLLQIPCVQRAKALERLREQGIYDPDGWIVAHVRRGDYIQPNFSSYHNVTTPEYFQAARKEIEKRLGGQRTVVWITEDPDYIYKTTYRYGDRVLSGDSIHDFAALSLFRHVIMSNSSYSWWAVWLNPQHYDSRYICAPSRWFGPAGPKDYETVYEPGWILMDPSSGNFVRQA